ncbi:hypothetical protein AGMMS49975_18270 [Clostridia bacterium]|nr:hypothetical protein AGMMS49975_18270 [Clostridia bacterium]
MLITFDETVKLIQEGKLLHLAGCEDLIRKLPKGNWVAGSAEQYMTAEGGKTSSDRIFANVLQYEDFKVSVYDENDMQNVANDAYDNGYTLLIIPALTKVHVLYAEKSPEFENIFLKTVAGWICGANTTRHATSATTINGVSGEAFTDKAVALHIRIPDGKVASIGIVNIFEQDENSPTIEFDEVDFKAVNAKVDGEEVKFAEYIRKNNIDIAFPLVGEYSGFGINTSIQEISPDGTVSFAAPVFPNIKYKTAKPFESYVDEFASKISLLKGAEYVFSCNCLNNFVHGKLEGKNIDTFFGPVTYGEIAYQLINQTLVYVTVS